MGARLLTPVISIWVSSCKCWENHNYWLVSVAPERRESHARLPQLWPPLRGELSAAGWTGTAQSNNQLPWPGAEELLCSQHYSSTGTITPRCQQGWTHSAFFWLNTEQPSARQIEHTGQFSHGASVSLIDQRARSVGATRVYGIMISSDWWVLVIQPTCQLLLTCRSCLK